MVSTLSQLSEDTSLRSIWLMMKMLKKQRRKQKLLQKRKRRKKLLSKQKLRRKLLKKLRRRKRQLKKLRRRQLKRQRPKQHSKRNAKNSRRKKLSTPRQPRKYQLPRLTLRRLKLNCSKKKRIWPSWIQVLSQLHLILSEAVLVDNLSNSSSPRSTKTAMQNNSKCSLKSLRPKSPTGRPWRDSIRLRRTRRAIFSKPSKIVLRLMTLP